MPRFHPATSAVAAPNTNTNTNTGPHTAPDAVPDTGPLDGVLAEAIRATGASVGMLYLLAPGEQTLQLVAAAGLSRQIAAPWERIPVDTPIPVADALAQRRLIWLNGQEAVAGRYPRLGFMLPYEFMLAAAPVADGGEPWGGVVLLWPVSHAPELSKAERKTITACCRRAADLLQRAADSGRPLRLPDQPRVLLAPRAPLPDPARARAALDFTARLPVGCCALDLDGRLTFINEAGAELVGADAAVLVGSRPWDVLKWLQDPMFEDRYRAAVISRQPTSFTARRPPGAWLFFQLYPDDSGISIHITAAGGEPESGDVAAEHPLQGRPLGATALYHLTHLATSLAEAVDVGDVVRLAADQIVPAFGPQGLVLMGAEDGRLHVLAHRGYSPEFIDLVDGQPLHAAWTAARVVATGQPVFFGSFEEFQRMHAEAPRFPGRNAWAFLPLAASGHVVGSMVLSYDRPRPFPAAERALLTSLSGLIAQALDRARLYDAKHALARALQAGLLPDTLPGVDGLEVAARYQPAGVGMDVGGDFYDLIRCGPTTAIAVIGDVQGHNSAAAALMGQLRTAIHAHATVGSTPGKVLARTNRLLTELDPDLLASCLVALIDLDRHRALVATAGHPPALLRHPEGRTEIPRLRPGPLLGVDPESGYATTEVPLPDGAVLVLYTDGLVERPGADIDHAMADLADHVAAADVRDLEALADTMLRHAELSAPRNDDIALLLLRTHGVGSR